MAIAANDWKRLSKDLALEEPSTRAQLVNAESSLGYALPKEYKEFLEKTNGAEGFVGDNSFVNLWRAEELQKLNADYEVENYAPGFLIFGSDGGGEAFAFDLTAPNMPIVKMLFVGMGRETATPISATFWEFLEALYQS